MLERFLGLDTSNYRTSAAIYTPQSGSWQNEGGLLSVPDGAIGLRQSDALFQHTVRLHEKIASLPQGDICAIGVSTRPRAVEGSYMPCFLAGESVARSAAHLLCVPFFGCSHQQGHVVAAALSANRLELLDRPFLAWHLSGGTTELLRVTPGEDGLPNCNCIGGSEDLSAGQLLDRAGALLQMPFPAGAALDRLAQRHIAVDGFQVKVKNGFFSLSGIQNQIEKCQKEGKTAEYIARFALETVANAVFCATEQVRKCYDEPILCAGGVMASVLMRARLGTIDHIHFAQPALSGDNAVGPAVLAARQYERTKK